jgi:hypothetical protein
MASTESVFDPKIPDKLLAYAALVVGNITFFMLFCLPK